MAWFLFFRPENVTTLPEVRYVFETRPELGEAAEAFRADLAAVDRQIAELPGNPGFLPLSQISSSIQY